MLDFKITVDTEKILRSMQEMANNQLPYATAKALTDTAKDVQTEVLRTLPSKFKLRTGWWQPGNKYGFKVNSATKQNLQAKIYTDAPWMTMQEEGGIKIPHNGKKMIAIPTDNVMRLGNGLIREDQTPAYLLRGYTIKGRSKAKGMGKRAEYTGVQAFIGTVHGQLGIWLRLPGHGLKCMYLLRSDTKISPRLFFIQTGSRIVAQRFHINFTAAWYEAQRTAR